MKKNEIKELSKMDAKALKAKLVELKKSYVEAINAAVRKEEKNVHIGYVIEKDIARVLTFIRQKELGL